MDTNDYLNGTSMHEHIEELAGILEAHELTRLEYDAHGIHVVLEKIPVVASTPAPFVMPSTAMPMLGVADTNATVGTAAAAAKADVAGASKASDTAAKLTVKAPLLGTAYRAKEPGALPFVSVGDKVEEGSVLCLIEAMKMLNEVTAPSAGTVTAIHFDNAQLVEYGELLFSLD